MAKKVSKKRGETPLMKQYNEIKAKYPGAMLLFRVGDFYETFHEDAKELHRIADIKLAKRSNGAASDVPLAGFPHHALDVYLPKLVRAGRRVAICDQLESPQKGKEVVKRGVTEMVTPGLTYHDQVLDKKQNNYLASIHFHKDIVGIALLDISTGEFLVSQGEEKHIKKLVESYQPAEIIFNKKNRSTFTKLFQQGYHYYMLEDWVYHGAYGYKRLNQHFATTTLKGFGIEDLPQGIVAAGAILHYLEEVEQHHLQHINAIARIEQEKYMWLDKFTIRNLELITPQHEDGMALIEVLDHTRTPMGGRRLKSWLLRPLKELTSIQERLDMVAVLASNTVLAESIGQHLKYISDLERLISKVASKRVNPRELEVLKKSLKHIAPIQALLMSAQHPLFVQYQKELHACTYLINKITDTLQEHPPISTTQGGLIRSGVSDKLDEYRSIALQGSTCLQQIQEKEKKRTNISSLKIGYNKVFGYYLEVTHRHKEKVPAEWIRKQTLVNAERYITQELKEYEEKILHAQEHIVELEQQIYQQLVEESANFVSQIQQNARVIGRLDSYHALAQVSNMYNYVKPLLDMGHVIDIQAGRHPVIERCLPIDQPYIANDTYLDTTTQQILLITGPNMAGKSALLRQVAHIVLLAHIGSFVPAKKAHIGLIDKIFTRVGASDNIAKRESTFMVEMNEMASILHNLSARSLVVVDELGRGTGTSDGLALAQSIIEYMHNHPLHQAKMLFATHYHRLNNLTHRLPKVKNYKVAVKEIEGKIFFLHRLEPGGSQHSFGIEVAKMAGIPKSIIEYAHAIVSKNQTQAQEKNNSPQQTTPYQLTLFEGANTHEKVVVLLKKVDINTLTPIEALLKLSEIKKLL